MKEAEKLIKMISNTQQQEKRLITDQMNYALHCFLRFGTVIPKYKGIIYNFMEDKYESYEFNNLDVSSNAMILETYNMLCRQPYLFGFRTIMTSMVMPIVISQNNVITGKENTETCLLLFRENEIECRFKIYRFTDQKELEFSLEYTKNIKLPPMVMNLGLIISTQPVFN